MLFLTDTAVISVAIFQPIGNKKFLGVIQNIFGFKEGESGDNDNYADCFTNIIASSGREAIQKFKVISDRAIFHCYLIF